MRVGGQRFSVRRERLERRDKGVILKGKEAGQRLPFEVGRKMEPGRSMLRVRFQGKI